MRCSAVIPLHNGAATVLQAVGSALAQTVGPAEVVVVDDGSTDGGAELVRATFPTAVVVEQPNRGPGAARNAGIAAAGADWIAFLDADDVWLPWHLATLAATAAACPEAQVVAGSLAARRAGAPVPDLGPFVGAGRRADPRSIDYFRAAARDIGVVHSSTVAVRRVAFDRVGNFGDAPRGQDLEMWARLALSVPVATTAVPTAVYSLGIGITAAFERGTAGQDLPPVPTELAALSPSARTVCAALATGDHLPPATSLRRYLDSRLAWTMRARIAAGDVAGTRALRSLATSTAWPENAAPMLAGLLPPAVLTSLLRARRAARRLLP